MVSLLQPRSQKSAVIRVAHGTQEGCCSAGWVIHKRELIDQLTKKSIQAACHRMGSQERQRVMEARMRKKEDKKTNKEVSNEEDEKGRRKLR